MSVDNCLARTAAAKGKSQTTLRFARSAPAKVSPQPAAAASASGAEEAAGRVLRKRSSNDNLHSSAAAVRSSQEGPSQQEDARGTPPSPARRKRSRTGKMLEPPSPANSPAEALPTPAEQNPSQEMPWSSFTRSASKGLAAAQERQGAPGNALLDPNLWTPTQSTASTFSSAAARSPHQHEEGLAAAQPEPFCTFAMGRRFCPLPATAARAGQLGQLRHEPSNPRDPNALLVVSETLEGSAEGAAVLGYLPALVASLLAPLLLGGVINVNVTVLEPPKTPKASIPIKVQVQTLISSICRNEYCSWQSDHINNCHDMAGHWL